MRRHNAMHFAAQLSGLQGGRPFDAQGREWARAGLGVARKQRYGRIGPAQSTRLTLVPTRPAVTSM